MLYVNNCVVPVVALEPFLVTNTLYTLHFAPMETLLPIINDIIMS